MTENFNWVVETRKLTHIYSGEVYALNDVDLQVAHGEFISIMGPSGSGKSTLLNMIGALDKPSSGEVFIDGHNLIEIRNKDVFRSKTVGFVFQLHNLLPTMTARENIEIPMAGHASPGQKRKRSGELLELVGLSDRMNHLPGQLSGGQRQRVAVARALANNPPLVLADEPTGSLDSIAGKDLIGLLRTINRREGTTFIIVTHDLSVARQTSRIVTMQDGKIVREDKIGTPIEEDLKIFRHSELGESILQKKSEELQKLGITSEQAEILHSLLESSNSNLRH